MHFATVLLPFLVPLFIKARADLYEECAKIYNPKNYISHLPSLKLPYFGNIAVPVNNPALIKPSAVVKTKAVSVVTKYVYKNPVCVKYVKNKSLCRPQNNTKQKGDFERLVTKEYFVNDGGVTLMTNGRRHKNYQGNGGDENEDEFNTISELGAASFEEDDIQINSSEDSTQVGKKIQKTPELTINQIHEMLIEDRLDQLETILPHYTRRRVFETSTITVTKVLSNRRVMATLIAKNCMPYGFDACPKKNKRKSKIARVTDNMNENERHYFG